MAAPHHPMVTDFLVQADKVWGDGYAAVLHGSAARGDFIEGRSDLNLLVVAGRLDPADLRGVAPVLSRFEREAMSPPLLIPRGEWDRAADVFPIEISDMRSGYEVLRGSDPLAPLVIRPRDLRHALEAELRGKLLRLRLDFGLYHGDQSRLAAVVGHSIGPIRVLLRATVTLAGRPTPRADDVLARETAGVTGADEGALGELLPRRRATSWRCPAALFERYLGIVEGAVRFVDHFHTGDA